MPTRVGLLLAARSSDCRVLIGDVDITESCVSINVNATVGEPTRVVLWLRAPVEIIGDAGHLHVNPPDQE